MRTLAAQIIAPIMAITGFRFSKEYRWGETVFHKAVYTMVSTVEANIKADALAGNA